MANPKLQSLTDSMYGPAINTAVWNNSSSAPDVTLDAALDRVAIACQSYYPILSATGPYDATGSYLFARMTPAPVGNGSTQTIMRIALDASNRVTYYTDGGGILTARVTNAGVNTDVAIGAYDAYNHAWWRIRESGGTILFDTSPDGYTWISRASTAYTWNATAVSVVFLCGYYAAESAGMFGYVDHVNTLSSAPDQPNLNWPQVEEAWGPWWNANAGTQPLDKYIDVTPRTRRTSSSGRGRQYELDQVRSGEASATLANTDAALDPVNSGGPWAGHIQPYQPYRRRAQWPPTRNLLDQVMATGGDLGGYSLGVIPQGAGGADIFSATDSSGGSFVSSATAWQGSTVMQFSVPSGTAASTRIVYTPRCAALPGQTYTVQLRARNVTASTSLSVRAFFGHYTSLNVSSLTFGTPATLTGSATAAWTTLTATVTIPTGGVGGMSCGLALDVSAAAATCSIQVDGWQMEKGAAATTWQAPGVWFPVYAGWTERWSPSWDMAGTYGIVEPSLVDTFSLLSQQTLSDPLTEEISSLAPRFVYKLDDPAGSTTASDWTGNYPAAQIAISKYGAGSLVFGTAITATDATGVYTGSSGTVATLNNSNPGTNLISPATFLKLTSAGIKGPVDPTLWTRMMAFRYTGPMPASSAVMWSCMDTQRAGGVPSGSQIIIHLGTDGKPVFYMQGPTGASVNIYFTGATNCVDGDWHLLVFGYNQAAGQICVSQDGSYGVLTGVSSTAAPTGIAGDNLGAFVDITIGNGTAWNFKGDISFAAEFPTFLSSTAVSNLYQAWRSACSGESTDARYARILRYAGYSGYSQLQSGLTASMGPASLDGQDAMSALQAVVDTENGAHYIDRNGWPQFKARSNRYNTTTPTYVFGENVTSGEFPYEDCQLDYDSAHLSNQVTVTRESSGQNFYAADATSVANYFPRTMSRTVNSTDVNECQDAADYLLSRYKQPAQRVSSLKLHPSASPLLWPVCLNLELGTRVRVMRRPPGLPVIQVDCFVENIAWDWDDSGDAWCTLQCSPADLTPYGVIAAWHTTLASSIASGVTSVTVNASADNTNPLAAQLAPGQQIVLGQNTANQETVTVSAVGATSPGWTTATITLTAVTTKAHTSGNTVCELLPAGTTDPTTWDSVSKFDSITFAY